MTAEHLGVSGKTAIITLGTLPTLAISGIAIMLPAIASGLGRDPTDVQIGMISTALGLGMFFGAPLSGWLTDRFTARRILLCSALAVGFFGCALMIAPDLWALVAFRFIIGIAAGAIGVASSVVIGNFIRPDAQGRWIGYGGAAAVFFSFIAIPLTGLLTDQNWRLGFLLYLVAFPIAALVFYGIPRDGPPGNAKRGDLVAPGAMVIPVKAIVLAFLIGTLSTGTSLYWPFRLQEIGITSSSGMALHALPHVTMIGLASFGYGKVREHFSVTQVFTVGCMLSAAGLLILALAPNSAVFLLGLVLEGLGIGLITPNLTAFAIMTSDPESRGRQLGLVKGTVYGSPFIVQFLLYPLNKAGGSALALVGIAAMAISVACAVQCRWIGHTREAI